MYKIFNDSIEYSGNNTTLNRLQKLLNISSTNIIENNIIGIHAYKFGKLVIDKNINFILIIGGTDINHDIENIYKIDIIMKACSQAKYIVIFNSYLKKKIIKLFNIHESKLKVIPQSVNYIENKYFNLKNYLKEKFNLINLNKIFMMVGNLRPVKDPLYFNNIFKKLKEENIILILIGNIVEGDYIFNDGIYYLGPFEKPIISSLYNQVDGLLNTSISEGMSSSILEAMLNKCPVYARNIDGNCSLIENNYNGFLFNLPKDFLELYNLDTTTIVSNAYNYVINNHNPLIEQKKYYDIINNL